MGFGLIEIVVLIGLLAVAAQWIAWRLRIPGIVLLAASGLLIGPGLGLLAPARDFGALYQPMISLAVAVILFEGGMHLKLADLRAVGGAVWRLALLAAPLAMALTAWAGVAVLGLSWPSALLFGGVMVVTGPTVIMPLLRQARLRREPAAVLKWEGIVNDPIGALLAVLAFELATLSGGGGLLAGEVILSLLGAVAAGGMGYGAGRVLAHLIHRGLLPEFIMGPTTLALALAAFLFGNLVQHEAGLVAVTVFGLTLANTGLADIEQIRRMKEYVTVMLVSGLFIILSASLDPDALIALGWPAMAFLALMILVIRPVSILLGTIGAGISWPTRLLTAWIAPRGIVAVAVSGLFSVKMVEAGFADAAALAPLAFAVVFTTVLAHGFTLAPLARRLGLSAGGRQGVLVVGANAWSTELARMLAAEKINVLIADSNPARLHRARAADLPSYRGDILSEFSEHLVDLAPYQHLLAVSDDDAYNALVCSQFGPELGRRNTAQLPGAKTGGGGGWRPAARGRVLIGEEADSEFLDRRMRRDWRFVAIDAEDFTQESEAARDNGADPAETAIVIARIGGGRLSFALADAPPSPNPGDRLLVFAPPGFAERLARRAQPAEEEAPPPPPRLS